MGRRGAVRERGRVSGEGDKPITGLREERENYGKIEC